MNATQTATQNRVNWNGRKAPTCACGRKAYCDNSCNTFAKRREFELAALWAMAADGCAAEGESFSEWKRRTGGAR